MEAERDRFEIVSVKSGARSVRSREFGETFHPVVGPMSEAQTLHVRQQRLLERAAHTDGRFVIWDVGLGAAANAIAVLEAFRGFRGGARIEIHSFDETTAPLEFALEHARELDYVAPHEPEIRAVLAGERWDTLNLHWEIHCGDFRELIWHAVLPVPHAILYDPYSAKSNPRMWTLEHFRQLRGRLRSRVPCMLTNYTRSTAVRVTLLLAGFFVGRGVAIGEKEETTVAANALGLIDKPLDRSWLESVRRSTRSAPLRENDVRGPIGDDDWKMLNAHRQFAC